jgi:Fe-S oxidoreductase
VAPQRTIPRIASESFDQWFRNRTPSGQGDRGPVILWIDTWNNYFSPEVAIAATSVLERAGYDVRLPGRRLCCGRPLYDYGFLREARHLLRRNVAVLADDVRDGVPVVGLEPSCVSVFRDELPAMLPRSRDATRVAASTRMLGEFLDEQQVPLPVVGGRALVHGHCHHKSVLDFDRDVKVLEAAGVDVEVLDSGCCGMAGSFGFEADHYDVSIACGERVLLPAVRAADAHELLVTDGFSCREQILQATGRRSMHLAEVLAMPAHDTTGA